MDRRILVVFSGGTICSAVVGKERVLDTGPAKRELFSLFPDGLFEDSVFPQEDIALSENLTVRKLERLYLHLRGFDFGKYSGIVILCGTDTLAFGSSLFSFLFHDTPVPVMLTASNRPPADREGNARADFAAAVRLIAGGIAPGVYAPYRNSDGRMIVHSGSGLMQCANFSEDFYSAPDRKCFVLPEDGTLPPEAAAACAERSAKRSMPEKYRTDKITELSEGVLLVNPYIGLDYSRISLDGVEAAVHGTYHSGTVCAERKGKKGSFTSRSFLYFAARCEERDIPLFVAPDRLDPEQYSSVFDVKTNTSAVFLDMTTEAAYCKAIVGLSLRLAGDELAEFMSRDITGESMSRNPREDGRGA